MSEKQFEAQLKAVAWAIVAALGWQKAVDMLKRMAAEIENREWS